MQIEEGLMMGEGSSYGGLLMRIVDEESGCTNKMNTCMHKSVCEGQAQENYTTLSSFLIN